MTDTTKRTSDEAEQVESLPERQPAGEADEAKDVKGGIIIDYKTSSSTSSPSRLDTGGIVGPEY